MTRVLMIVLRVLLAMVLGLFGLFAAMTGVYQVGSREFVLFGGPGAMMLSGVLVGAALIYLSGRLMKKTLAAGAS